MSGDLRQKFDDLPSQARKGLVLALVLAFAIVAVLTYRITTSPQTSGGPDGAETTSLPTATYSTTTTPSVELPPGMSNRPTDEPTTSSSPSRPSATTTPEADEALRTINGETDITKWVPKFATLWNSFYPKNGISDGWRSNINAYCTTDAQRRLDREGSTIWTGAVMNNSTVRPTSEPVARKLWEVADASMWRVSTTISIASTDPRYAAADGTARTVWDFYVKRQKDGTFKLDSWSEPTPGNENPNTYTPER